MTRARKISLASAALLLLFGGALWWLGGSEPGLRFLWSRVRLLSPVPLAGEVHGRLVGPLRVEGFRAELRGSRVEIAAADLDWAPWGLFQGRLRLSRAEVRELVITVKPRPAGAPAAPRVPAPALPIDLRGQVEGFTLRLPAGDGLREFRFERAAVDALAGPRQVTLRGLSLEGYGGRAEADGELALRLDGPVRLATRWEWRPPRGEALRGHGTLTGTLSRPRTDQSLDAGVEGTARGSLVWLDQPLRWQAELIARPVSLARLDRRARPLVVGGTLQAEGGAGRLRIETRGRANDERWGAWDFEAEGSRLPGGWRLPRVTLNSTEGPEQLAASGFLYTTGAARVAGELTWSGFTPSPTAAAASPAGRVTVDGSLDDYRVAGSARLARAGLPDGEVDLEGRGDRRAFQVTTLRADWLEGEVTGTGRLQWLPHLAWEAELRARDLNPGRWRADYPGRVALRLASRGERPRSGLRAELALEEVGGELRGNPLAGHGRFRWEQGQLRVESLELVNGTAALRAEGEWGSRWDLRADLEAERVEDLVSGLQGRVRAEVRVSGARRQPWLRVEAVGSALAWGERRADRLSLKTSIDVAGANPWDARLEGEGLRLGQFTFERLDLAGQGDPADHSLTLEAAGGGRRLHLEARGTYDERRWQGKLTAGRLDDPTLGSWTQAAPAALGVDRQSMRLDQTCWSHEGASLCAGVAGGMGREWRGEAALRAFPVAALQPFLREGLQLSGLLEGHAAFRFHDALTALDLNLAATDGAVALQLTGADAVATAYRRLDLRLSAGNRGLRGEALLDLANGDGARAELLLPRWRPGQPLAADQPLRGWAQASLGELVWVSMLVPEVAATGRLEGRFTVGGTLGRPLLDGQMALNDGQLALPMLGISLSRLRLALQPDRPAGMRVTASALSGKGRLNVTGQAVPQGERWGLTLQVTGSNVEVMRLPQARILASPDLEVTVADHALHLRGVVVIPTAKVDLPELVPPVQSSADVVVVDRPDEAGRRRWTITSEVTLRFGEEVRLAGYGLAGRLGGELMVVEPAGGGALGRGELQILDGKYTAYGQDLTIEEGRLIYGNAPLNNPGIQFRAVRQLEQEKVGIIATGRLKKPEVRLYSEPAMEESEVLARLVLGRPLEDLTEDETGTVQRAALSLGLVGGNELARRIGEEAGLDVINLQPVSAPANTTTGTGNGTTTTTNGGTGTGQGASQPYQAALVLGKYFSPRLYVQYAVGLWDAADTWQMRYLLDKNWTLKAESGLQSGLDLLYTIEK